MHDSTIFVLSMYESSPGGEPTIVDSTDCSLCLSLTDMGYRQAMRLLGQLLQVSTMPPGLWLAAFPVGEPLEGLLPQAGGCVSILHLSAVIPRLPSAAPLPPADMKSRIHYTLSVCPQK